MKKLLSVVSVVALMVSLTACNTINGAGKDIEKGGEHVQDAAKNVQQDMKSK